MGATGTENANGTLTNTLGASASPGSTSFSAGGTYFLSLDVQSILTSNCTSCHFSGGTSPNLTSGSTFGSTVNVTGTCDTGKKRVAPSSASTSILYLRVTTTTECGGPMPPDGGSVTLSAANAKIIRLWINNGAQNN